MAKEHSTSIKRMQQLIDIRCLSGIHVPLLINTGKGLLIAVTRAISALWTTSVARAVSARTAHVALPLAYVSKMEVSV